MGWNSHCLSKILPIALEVGFILSSPLGIQLGGGVGEWGVLKNRENYILLAQIFHVSDKCCPLYRQILLLQLNFVVKWLVLFSCCRRHLFCAWDFLCSVCTVNFSFREYRHDLYTWRLLAGRHLYKTVRLAHLWGRSHFFYRMATPHGRTQREADMSLLIRY